MPYDLGMATNTLILESAPLHTEKPVWAKDAPKQIEAALKRGAHVIALTELHTPVTGQARDLAEKHGYVLIGVHDTGLLVKGDLHITAHGQTKVAGRFRTHVAFDFNGETVTVFGMHWATNKPIHQKDRQAQTDSLIAAMKAASADGFAFVLGDSNPTAPLSNKSGEPRHSLNAAGVVLAYQQVHSFPRGIGVSVIACQKNPHVKATKVSVGDALGSDHRPVTATYSVTTEPRPEAVQSAVDAMAEARADLATTGFDPYWQARADKARETLQTAINELLL